MADDEGLEAETFDAFFRSASRSLLATAYVLTGDLSAAQDLAQEALLRTWARWPRIRTYDDPVAWTRRVLRNLAVDKSRGDKVRTMTAVPTPTSPPPDDLHMALAAALRSLPDNQMTAVVLHDGAGVSIREIALQFSVPEGTVKSWLSRGRASAAAALAPSTTPTKEGHVQR